MPTERAKTLREWRKSAGQTQKTVAGAVGVHPVTWSEYERGKMEPSVRVLRRMAEHFGCSFDEIVLATESQAA